VTYKGQTRPLIREGAPRTQGNKFQTQTLEKEAISGQTSIKWARHKESDCDSDSQTYKGNNWKLHTRLFVREGAPHQQIRNCLKIIKERNLVVSPRWVADTKTDWPTNRLAYYNFDCKRNHMIPLFPSCILKVLRQTIWTQVFFVSNVGRSLCCLHPRVDLTDSYRSFAYGVLLPLCPRCALAGIAGWTVAEFSSPV
jgi:hypothetical protein